MTPTQEQLADILPKIRYEIEQALRFGEWRTRGAPSHPCELEAGLVHIRLLVEFFQPMPSRYQDSVLPGDFGFSTTPIGLPENVKIRLNKDLAHLTYSRLKQTPENKIWDPEGLTQALLPRCIDFVRHVLDHPPPLAEQSEMAHWANLLEDLTARPAAKAEHLSGLRLSRDERPPSSGGAGNPVASKGGGGRSE